MLDHHRLEITSIELFWRSRGGLQGTFVRSLEKPEYLAEYLGTQEVLQNHSVPFHSMLSLSPRFLLVLRPVVTEEG